MIGKNCVSGLVKAISQAGNMCLILESSSMMLGLYRNGNMTVIHHAKGAKIRKTKILQTEHGYDERALAYLMGVASTPYKCSSNNPHVLDALKKLVPNA